jgi:hypothetical protein
MNFRDELKQNLKLPGFTQTKKNCRLPGYKNKNMVWDITKRMVWYIMIKLSYGAKWVI